jgi:hypothetical protein
MRTPWGPAQSVEILAPGIGLVHTAGHGGIKCDRATNAAIPAVWRAANGWHEEDCACAIPFFFHATLLDLHAPAWLKESLTKYPALNTLKTTFWQTYEAFFNVTLQPGESCTKDQDLFYQQHANDLIGCSAFGDCFAGVPTGKVALVSKPGGYMGKSQIERWFLVPQDEYAARSGPFLIDPTRHTEIPAFDPSTKFDPIAERVFEMATRRLTFTTGRTDQIIRVARSIANLAHSDILKGCHVAEATQYGHIYWFDPARLAAV